MVVFPCRLGRFVVLCCSGSDDDGPVCRFFFGLSLEKILFEISVGPYEDVGTRFPGVVMCQGQRQLQWKLATTALECEKRGKGKIGLAVFWPGHAGHAWHSQTLDGNSRHGKNGGKVMGKRRGGGSRPSSPTAAPFSGHISPATSITTTITMTGHDR